MDAFAFAPAPRRTVRRRRLRDAVEEPQGSPSGWKLVAVGGPPEKRRQDTVGCQPVMGCLREQIRRFTQERQRHVGGLLPGPRRSSSLRLLEPCLPSSFTSVRMQGRRLVTVI